MIVVIDSAAVAAVAALVAAVLARRVTPRGPLALFLMVVTVEVDSEAHPLAAVRALMVQMLSIPPASAVAAVVLVATVVVVLQITAHTIHRAAVQAHVRLAILLLRGPFLAHGTEL
jgi:hypothetical protein